MAFGPEHHPTPHRVTAAVSPSTAMTREQIAMLKTDITNLRTIVMDTLSALRKDLFDYEVRLSKHERLGLNTRQRLNKLTGSFEPPEASSEQFTLFDGGHL